MEECKDPSCSSAGRSHEHIQLDEHSVSMLKAISSAAKMHAAGAEIEQDMPDEMRAELSALGLI